MTARRQWLFVFGAVEGVGGTERRMADAAAELGRRGIRVLALIYSDDDRSSLALLLRASGAEVLCTRSPAAFWRAVRTGPLELTITFGLRPSLATRAIRAIPGGASSPAVMARNGLDYRWKGWMHLADRLTSRLADGYITNSRSVADHLLRHGAPGAGIHVVPGALGDEWFGPPEPREPGRVIAMVGNRRPEKNQEFGLRAFLAAPVAAMLRVFTDDAQELRDALAGRGAGEAQRVEIVEGHRLTPADYDVIDVLLMPSLSESVPRVVLEAVARGCFVVTARIGGTADHLDPHHSIVLDGHDAKEWSRALATALEAAVASPRAPSTSGRTTRDYVDDLLALAARLDEERRR